MSEEELKRGLDRWFDKNYLHLRNEIANNICKDSMSEYTDELLSHCVIWFLERSHAQKQQMLEDNKIENYILRCCSMQLRSSTSPFYNEQRKFKMKARSGAMPDNIDEGIDILENTPAYICMQKEIKNLHWYYQKLLEEKWFNQMTYQQMRVKYGITLASLKTDLNIAINIIREKCKNC